MFCKKCGQPIADGVKFCAACGEPVPKTVDVAEVPVAEPMAETPAVEATPKKKGKKALIAVIVAAAAVVALAAVAIFTPLKNVFINMMSADKHMQYVYANLAEDAAGGFGKVYTVALKQEATAQAATGTMELQASEDVLKALASEADVDLSGLNKISVDYRIEMDAQQRCLWAMGLKLQDKELAKLNLYIDIKNNKAVIEIPDLLKKPIEIPLDMADMSGASVLTMNSFENIDRQSLPDESFIQEIIPRLAEVALAQITDVERESDEFTAGGVTQSATCLTAKIDAKTALRMADAVLEELKVNESVKEVIINVVDENEDLFGRTADGEDMYDTFVDALGGVQDALDEEKDDLSAEDKKQAITLKTWVNFTNDILAVAVEFDGSELFYGMATDGNKLGFEVSGRDSSEVLFEVKGNGTLTKGMLNADFVVSANGGEVLKMTVADLNLLGLKDGLINGTLTFVPGGALVTEAPMLKNGALKFTVKTTAESAEMTVDVLMQEKAIATLKLTETTAESKGITMPTDAVTVEEFTEDLLDAEAIMKRMKEVLPEALLAQLGGMGGDADIPAEDDPWEDAPTDDSFGDSGSDDSFGDNVADDPWGDLPDEL